MTLAPITIKFMLACYCSGQPAVELGTQWNSGAGQETLHWLQANGLIGDNYRVTERGEAWVKFICATPLPETVWVLPERARDAA